MADSNKLSGSSSQGDIADTKSDYFRPRYVKSLDGIRGVLILLVLLGHLGFVNGTVAFLAVNSFFVLSGFLITWLLVSEWNGAHAINLKDFYFRRVLRLFPALLVMLASFGIYTCLANPPARVARDFYYIFEALFYFTNWGQVFGLGEKLNFLAHTWSLSIEEQFYLLWPPMLLFLLRRTASKTSLLWWAVLATLCFVLVRAVTVYLGDPSWDGYWRAARGLDTRADSLLTGCTAGIVISAQLIPRRRWLELALLVGAAGSIFGLIWVARHDLFDHWLYYIGWFLASLFTALVIVHLVYSTRGVLHRIFETFPLVYIGIISYGLYIWHYPIISIVHEHYAGHWRVVSVPLIAAATLLSYFFVERPCLRLKRQFHRPRKSGRGFSGSLRV
jgi:peptidoglycan/LPS O-acetylase OafA/YrhL